MSFCCECGAEIPDNQAFCPQCGAPLDDILLQAESEAGQDMVSLQEKPDTEDDNGWMTKLKKEVSGVKRKVTGADDEGNEKHTYPETIDENDFNNDERLLVMLGYLLGIWGILYIFLSGKKSVYLNTHVTVMLELAITRIVFAVVMGLIGVTGLLVSPVIMLILTGVYMLTSLSVSVYCFVRAARGKKIGVWTITSIRWLNIQKTEADK